jgi:tripartite-type tricarboxylate transporter receptor subunit TctC
MRRRFGRIIDCRKAPSHSEAAVGQEKFRDAFAAEGEHEVMSGHTRRRVIELAAGASVLSFGPATAQTAQQWPPARIRFLVGTAPGGSPDVVGRLLAERLTDRWGTSVYVDNVTQAAGAVAYRTIARSVPDGSTMGILTSGYSGEVTLRPDPSYDPIAGFTFITMLCGYPLVYAVPINSPITSFADLLTRAGRDPGKLTYTITGYGSAYHLLTKWIELESGTSMTAVPYRGIAAGVADVLDGRVDLLVDASTSVIPRVKAGQFRVLALSSPARYALMPDAPTVSETLRNVQFMSWLCLAIHPEGPVALTERLNADVKDILQTPDFTKRLADLGSVPTPTSPEQTRLMVANEIARWADVIKRGNIKVE